jgi:predicted DsbA family dithiol-disulfide isomerase
VNKMMRIDVWSDVVCPWCYIGKRRLETALDQFEHADQVELHWHSFQLDPTHPKGLRQPVYDTLAAKYGAQPAEARAMTQHVTDLAVAEDLHYEFDRAVTVNTFDAHRLGHLAARHGLGDRMHERLLKAHLVDGEVVDDLDTLVRLGAEVGVPADEARTVLQGTQYADEVDGDIQQARRYGITGVPFFVLDGAYGVSGAQSADIFLSALRQAHAAAA